MVYIYIIVTYFKMYFFNVSYVYVYLNKLLLLSNTKSKISKTLY